MIKPDPKIVAKINRLSRLDMARLWRFAPTAHDYFNTLLPYHDIFKRRFEKLGGFSPAISKAIGFVDV